MFWLEPPTSCMMTACLNIRSVGAAPFLAPSGTLSGRRPGVQTVTFGETVRHRSPSLDPAALIARQGYGLVFEPGLAERCVMKLRVLVILAAGSLIAAD